MKTWLRLVIITVTVGGGFAGFVQTAWMLFNPENQHPFYIVTITFFSVLYAFITISGLIFVQYPHVLFPLRLALWLQVPSISSSIVIYQLVAGFHFTIKLVEGLLTADGWLGSNWIFYLFQEVPGGFGVNVFALFLLVLLARPLKSSKVTASRATQMPGVQPSFVEEIDRRIQSSLTRAGMPEHSIHVYEQADGNVAIAVNHRIYPEVDEIEETEVRELIQGAIHEWQNSTSTDKD